MLELARKQGWAVVALDLAVDTSTPAGEMFGKVLLTIPNPINLIRHGRFDGSAKSRM